MKVIKTVDFQVTTREALWTDVFTSAIEAGFSIEKATEQTSRVVDLIFERIGPAKEAALRLQNEAGRLRPSFIPPATPNKN